MKRLLSYLLALPALALTGTWLSCSSETDDMNTGSQGRVPVQIEMAGIDQTRAILEGSTLPDETTYGVFVTSTSSPTGNILEDGSNRRVSYIKGTSTMDTPVFIPEGGNAYIWAYWPYNFGNGSSLLEAFPLEAKSQTDYLVGRGTRAATESTPTVPVSMTHAMSRLHITVRNDSTNDIRYTIPEMYVGNVYTTGYYYYGSGSVKESQQGSISVKTSQPGTGVYTADILIVPSSSYITAQLSLPGTDFEGISLPSRRYEMGKQYNVDVVINLQKQLVIQNVWITDWQTINQNGLEMFADDKIDDGTDEPTPNPVGEHEAVDLGLSVKWATMNVGANKPEEYGDYFAWGETTTKEEYSWATYKFCEGTEKSLTKYCASSDYGIVDNKITLEAEDDAATVHWGDKWRMPTLEEATELTTKCSWKWVSANNVYGFQVIGPNGNSIFLPSVGLINGTNISLTKSNGYYWTSTVSTKDSRSARYFYFNNTEHSTEYYYHRSWGKCVRPVIK